jgi:hypothetical protein
VKKIKTDGSFSVQNMAYPLIVLSNTKYSSARGEIGKHSRLKICRLHGLAGSSPAERTTILYPYNALFFQDNY